MKAIPFKLKQRGNYSYFYLPDVEASGIVHGFCIRTTPPPPWDPGARLDFLSTFSFRDCVTMQQEHKDKIHTIRDDAPTPQAGDGLVLVKKGVAGIIRTADCVPIILWEPTRRIAAIVHAGWRGTVMRIAGKAARILADLGATPSLMQALIGPSIGSCCYEVKEDVLGRFWEAGYSETNVTRRNKSTFLDLKKANVEDLMGQQVNNIRVLDLCTRCRQDLFFSARRNETGRQMSFVAVTG